MCTLMKGIFSSIIWCIVEPKEVCLYTCLVFIGVFVCSYVAAHVSRNVM